jgi:transcriptional regulator with XRE-family HTH domain
MNTLAERLQAAFDERRHTRGELARAARVSQPSVSDWFRGETRSLKAEPLVRAAQYLGVAPLWLATGEGPMRVGSGHILAPAHTPPTLAEALEQLGIAIAAVPESLRAELADDLRQWAIYGGRDKHRAAVAETLQRATTPGALASKLAGT